MSHTTSITGFVRRFYMGVQLFILDLISIYLYLKDRDVEGVGGPAGYPESCAQHPEMRGGVTGGVDKSVQLLRVSWVGKSRQETPAEQASALGVVGGAHV